MQKRLTLGVLPAILVVGIVTGCGNSSKSATVRLDYKGEVAYMVVSVPGNETAVVSELISRLRSAGISRVVRVHQPHGPLACQRSTKIGQGRVVFPALRQYAGQTSSLTVYGEGQLADGLCKGVMSGAGG